LLKQPATNAIGAFTDLRSEIQGQRRQDRIDSRLGMLEKNLQTLRIWILNVYGLATAQNEPPDTPEDIVSLKSILSSAADNIHKLFDDFRCDLSDVDDIDIRLTRLKRQKVDAILFNLLDNSYKYSNKPDKQISASAKKVDHNVKLILRDNGKGIPQDEVALVFNPGFTSGNTSDKWPASLGLGLSTVARLLSELRWDKKIESQVGVGTRFIINIPEEYIYETSGCRR
jgi:signal transduction histidine kinase